MKFVTILMSLALSFASQARAADTDVQFKTLAQFNGTVNYHITCATIADQPTITFTFHNSQITAFGTSASMAVNWPKEGLLVRDWPYTGVGFPAISAWNVTGDATEMIISNSLFAPAELVTLTIEDSTNGRFKSYLKYVNTSTGKQFERELRCYANNYYPSL